jgi:hypothetical protein
MLIRFNHSSKTKSRKTAEINVFPTIFTWCWKDSDLDPYRTVPLTKRIREAQKLTDPEHWLKPPEFGSDCNYDIYSWKFLLGDGGYDIWAVVSVCVWDKEAQGSPQLCIKWMGVMHQFPPGGGGGCSRGAWGNFKYERGLVNITEAVRYQLIIFSVLFENTLCHSVGTKHALK